MELLDAQKLAISLIAKGTTHPDYEYVVELADTYKKIITGKNIDSLLRQFVQRESDVMFEQRKRITQAITPAAAAAVRTPFNKVPRNKKVTKSLGIQEEARKAIVERMIKEFYGTPEQQNSGFDGWMASRFVDLTFTDPNAWLVIEWDAMPENKAVQPRPFVVSASQAVNFSVVNGQVKWLFVRQSIKYPTQKNTDPNGNTELLEAAGNRFTLYDADYTLVLEQVDEAYTKQNTTLAEGETLLEINKAFFVLRVYTPRLGYAPAFRLGYETDLNTDSRTFVSPMEPAMCYFKKSIKAVSELDLTVALHTFPQKYQYVSPCKGVNRNKPCKGGRIADGSICENCKGEGYKVHTSAQDVVLLPMPDDAKEMIRLSDLVHYSAPPVEIVNIQRDITRELKEDVIKAVFNSQVFVQQTVVKTATQATVEMDSVYDKLASFADKFSELWRGVVKTFVILSGLQGGAVNVVHSFPADLKLKSVSMLLADLAAINDSMAPSFMREEISHDIASTLYADDPIAMKKFETKARFFPFGGKSAEDIAMAVASEFVSRFDKVLYYNFEKIFAEIDRDIPTFWLKGYAEQWKIVGEKVNVIIDSLGTMAGSRFSISDLTGVNRTQNNQQQESSAPSGNNPTQ